MVLRRQLSNPSPSPLTRALRAYRRLNLAGPTPVQPARHPPKRAIQLNRLQLAQLAAEYEAGATVYQLAGQFHIDRRTVALHLHRMQVELRLQSPTETEVDEMVQLYGSGLSLMRVAGQTGFAAETIRRYLRARRVQLRDTHGR